MNDDGTTPQSRTGTIITRLRGDSRGSRVSGSELEMVNENEEHLDEENYLRKLESPQNATLNPLPKKTFNPPKSAQSKNSKARLTAKLA